MERLTELAISRRSPKLGSAPRFNGEVLGAITLAKLPRLLGRRVSGRSLRHSLIGVLDVFDNPRVWTGRLEPSFHLNPYRQRLLSARAHEKGGSGVFRRSKMRWKLPGPDHGGTSPRGFDPRNGPPPPLNGRTPVG